MPHRKKKTQNVKSHATNIPYQFKRNIHEIYFSFFGKVSFQSEDCFFFVASSLYWMHCRSHLIFSSRRFTFSSDIQMQYYNRSVRGTQIRFKTDITWMNFISFGILFIFPWKNIVQIFEIVIVIFFRVFFFLLFFYFMSRKTVLHSTLFTNILNRTDNWPAQKRFFKWKKKKNIIKKLEKKMKKIHWWKNTERWMKPSKAKKKKKCSNSVLFTFTHVSSHIPMPSS